MADSYHHGNLREALIDAGIKIINENGEENLSLRKVAAACGVSHAAPYAHFKDKEELIDAIKANVTDKFMEKLIDAVEGKPTVDAAIIAMGRAYVTFFSQNPDYFIFLFVSIKGFKFKLSAFCIFYRHDSFIKSQRIKRN